MINMICQTTRQIDINKSVLWPKIKIRPKTRQGKKCEMGEEIRIKEATRGNKA